MSSPSGPANRLAGAPSAYLRSAAHQPVAWYPWGREAFEAARRDDKPILLDVGAVWCHWCHVMDHESYEDADLARLINERFVPVKVDRDERPDVDARYQRLVSAMTRQGGWPLTAFLTPQGSVFYGGTYFPPQASHGRPSFRTVLEAVSDAYRTQRDECVRSAEHVEHLLRQHEAPPAGLDAAPDAARLDAAAHRLGEHFDAENGGWGTAPKFPHPSAVEALILRAGATGDAEARARVEATLDGMGRGGVHDHVAGGFHRYGVDAEWLIPHFEKMLYDNAELLRNYAHAYRAFGRDRDRAVAEDTLRFLLETLADRDRGGFYGSQDADVGPGDDGDHFTWTEAEIHAAAGDEAVARALVHRFGVGVRGAMHHDPARHVLHAEASVEEVAAAQNRPVDDVARDLDVGMQRLRAARTRRPRPVVDPVHYTNWNAMAVRACLEAGAILDRPDATAFALRTLDRFLADAWVPGRGFRHTLDPSAPLGLLDDHAQMLPALVAAYSHTQDSAYLDRAREVADLLLDAFLDVDAGGFRDVARGVHDAQGIPALMQAQVPWQDAPSPSANARAVEGLVLVCDLVKDGDRYRGAAATVLARAWPLVERLGLFAAHALVAAHHLAHPPPRVVVAGPAGTGPGLDALVNAARTFGPPGTRVLVADGDEAASVLPPEAAAFAAGPARDRPGAMVCVGTRCLRPAFDAASLRDALLTAMHK